MPSVQTETVTARGREEHEASQVTTSGTTALGHLAAAHFRAEFLLNKDVQ